MNGQSARRDLIWMVCEEGDRWYAAICRFAPELVGGEHRLRVERFGADAAALAAAANRHVGGPGIVLWELPIINPVEFLNRLDWIVTLRSESKHVFQMAWLPSTAPPELFLAAREAGIAFFLESTESLQRLREIVAQQLSPLG